MINSILIDKNKLSSILKNAFICEKLLFTLQKIEHILGRMRKIQVICVQASVSALQVLMCNSQHFYCWYRCVLRVLTCAARHGYCEACILLGMCTARQVYCEACVLRGMGTARQVYSEACVLRGMYTARHVYCEACILRGMCTVRHVYGEACVLPVMFTEVIDEHCGYGCALQVLMCTWTKSENDWTKIFICKYNKIR